MTIPPEMQEAIAQADGGTVELTDPRTNTTYILIRSDVYREMRELLDDERERENLTMTAKRHATARMDLSL